MRKKNELLTVILRVVLSFKLMCINFNLKWMTELYQSFFKVHGDKNPMEVYGGVKENGYIKQLVEEYKKRQANLEVYHTTLQKLETLQAA